MQNLMVDFIISLDGYGAAEGWPGYWGMEVPSTWRDRCPAWRRRVAERLSNILGRPSCAGGTSPVEGV